MLEILEDQVCYVNRDGYMLCNYIFRNGNAIYTKSGKRWRWFVGIPSLLKNKSKMKKEVKREIATPLSEVAISHANHKN